MVLLYHRLYETDLAATMEKEGSYRDVRMSWSHTNPQTDETTVVILIDASSTSTEPEGGKDTTYLLKVSFFAAVEKAGNVGGHVLKKETAQREIYSALFELHAPLDAAVLKGTSGVLFLSTRQFFFYATADEKSLDRFVFLAEERAWERQRGAVRPLDHVGSIRSVLESVGGDSKPHLLLITRFASPLASSPTGQKDHVDMLLVISKEERASKEGKVRQRMTAFTKKDTSMSETHASSVTPCHTFIVALLRCSMQAVRLATANWELLNLFVDRAVPFQQCVEGVQMWSSTVSKTGDNVIHPSQCIWCYLSPLDTGGRINDNRTSDGGQATGGARGVLVALVPQPSCALTAVCGGFDANNQAYRLGFATSQTTGGSSVPQQTAEGGDNFEETLWSLAEDTHTVRMLLLGTPARRLQSADGEHTENTTSRRAGYPSGGVSSSRSGWMRQAGLAVVLRFIVDFLDDGLRSVGDGSSLGMECQQGLYTVTSTLWEKSQNGRFPLPRNLCWLDLTPLPIGKAATSSALFFDREEEMGNDSISVLRTGMGDEDATAWYHALPTSVASSFPTHAGGGALRCFVSVNTLLQKTRLTYVLETNPAAKTLDGQKKLQASELLYMLPRRRNDNSEDGDETTTTEEENDTLPVCLARTAAMQSVNVPKMTSDAVTLLHGCSFNKISPEVVMREAWRSVALGKHMAVALSVLDQVAQSTEVVDTEEVRVLANALCHFLLDFLVELDWMTCSDSELLCGVVFLMLGAASPHKMSLSCHGALALRNETSLVPLLASNERRSMRLLLWRSEMWQPLANSLFAWVNQKLTDVESEQQILLEDVVQSWREMVVSGVTEGGAFDVLLGKLRASQDGTKFHSTIAALFRGNVSICDVASLTGLKDNLWNDSSILLMQLFLEVTLTSQTAAAATPMPVLVEGIDQRAASAVQERLQSNDVFDALVELLHEWNFDFLENWPFVDMCGGLPVVYVLLHLAALNESRVLDGAEDVVLTLVNATRLLHWLCDDTVARAAEVLTTLCAAKVPLIALCLVESPRQRSPSLSAVPLSGSEGGGRCLLRGVDGHSNLNRAHHHLLVSSTVSILKGALSVFDSHGPTEGTSSEAFALALWTLVLEGDEAAAFNPKLLRQLYDSLNFCGNTKTTHVASRTALLLDFLQPVFLSTLPRLFDAVVNQHKTVGCALVGMGNSTLGPPLDESEAVERVWVATLQEVRRLLLLQAEESLEIQCLLRLFGFFEVSCATILEKVKNDRPCTGDDGDGDGDRGGVAVGDVSFTFSPKEMYFVALQILSNEPARFIIAAEVMRRSLRPYLLHQLNYTVKQAEKMGSSPSLSLLTTAETREHSASERELLWCDSKSYLNDMADNLALAMSAFEETAPLYAHALLLLFLDESVALVENVEEKEKKEEEGKGGGGGEAKEKMGLFSLEVQRDMLQCATRAAHSHWAKLHRQEKSLLVRVLSRRLSLPGQEDTVWDTYNESQAHHQAVKDMSRMRESLQRRTLDAALLSAVKGRAHPTLPTIQGPMRVDGQNDTEEKHSVTFSNLTVFLKEEAYVRRHLQLRLMQEYDEFIASDAFRRGLGVLYLALREEQRRRVLVSFACDQHNIISSFAYNFFAMMRGACQRGACVLRQNAMEEFQRRVCFLLRQERESRMAVEAVCCVERDMLYNQSSEQRAMFDAETHLRLRHVEDEEVQRDVLYELFAREEMTAQQCYESRMEEEAWRQEEALWAAELSASDQGGRNKKEEREEEEEEEEGKRDRRKQNTANAFLQWQERQLAAMEERTQLVAQHPSQEQQPQRSELSSSSRLPPTTPTTEESSQVAGFMTTNDVLPPSRALEPILQMYNTAADFKESTGYRTLLESSETLFGALSRFQKKVISTVAPPPPKALRKETTAAMVSTASPYEQQQQQEKHMVDDKPLSALSSVIPPAVEAPPATMAKEDGWDDIFEDVPLSSGHVRQKNNEESREEKTLDDTPKTHDDSSKRLRLRALATTTAGKRDAPRKRRLGDVVCVNTVLEKTTDLDPMREQPREEQEKEESRQQMMDTIAVGDGVLCAAEARESIPHLDNMQGEGESGDVVQEDERLLVLLTCNDLAEGKTTLSESEVVAMAEEKEDEVSSGLSPEQAVALQGHERTTRSAIRSEEGLRRAFLFRRFILEA